MPDRAASIDTFLERAGWAFATRRPLAGDASNRRYLRLTLPVRDSAVLMDAPPERGEDVRPFVRVARHLAGLGLSTPEILASDEGYGLLLLEDLGDAIYTRVLACDASDEATLYRVAAEALAVVQGSGPPPGIGAFDPPLMAELAMLAWDWYARGLVGAPAPAHRAAVRDRIEDALAAVAPRRSVLVLRDFHADNLIWLADRVGAARAGLLDFQDALLGNPAYDLVSLVNDARRDVPQPIKAATIRHFLDLTGHEAGPFLTAAATVSAQRNLRILGVFARLSMHFGKPGYIRLIPRVWGHLMRDLEAPSLASLRSLVVADLPPPSADALSRLESQCAPAAP